MQARETHSAHGPVCHVNVCVYVCVCVQGVQACSDSMHACGVEPLEANHGEHGPNNAAGKGSSEQHG